MIQYITHITHQILQLILKKIDEYTGIVSGISTYFATNFLSINNPKMQTNDIHDEIILQCIRLVFAGLSAGVAYIVVHYLKKYFEKKKIKKYEKHKQYSAK